MLLLIFYLYDWSQVLMVLVCWATHVLQRWKQKVAKKQFEANLKKSSWFGLSSEIRGYEVEIVSNRREHATVN